MGMGANFKQQSLWDEPLFGEDSTLVDGVANLRTAFERRVLQGLAAEWENALWLMPEPLRHSLRKPIFSIVGTTSRLGSWAPYKREIALSHTGAIQCVADGRKTTKGYNQGDSYPCSR